MTHAAESVSIQSRFSTIWGNATAIDWPNVGFATGDKSEWVRFRILHEPAYQAAMGGVGNHLYRHPAFVSILIFVKPNTGLARVNALADMAANVWRGADFSGIKMGVPSINHVGVVDGWYQVNVLCSFYRDEVLSRSI